MHDFLTTVDINDIDLKLKSRQMRWENKFARRRLSHRVFGVGTVWVDGFDKPL